jgi:hypothetical protein
MAKSDIANIDITNKFVEGLMNSGPEVTPKQFGHALAVLMNRDAAVVRNQTNMLFEGFREMAYGKGIEVNLAPAFRFLKENADNRFARKVAAKVFRSDPTVIRSLKNGEEMLSWTDDQLENYFGSLPREEIQSLIDEVAGTIPVETAVDMFHNLNLMFGKSKVAGVKKFASEFKSKLDGAMEEGLGAVPGSYQAFQKANAYAAKHGKRLEQKIISQIFSRIGDNKPASIVHMMQGANSYDTFKAVERFFRTSDELTMQQFDRSVRAPLRHKFLSQVFDPNTGVFSGSSLDRVIKTATKRNGPEYLKELFGPKAPAVLQEAANTLKVLEQTRESNIVIKIIQAGVLMGGASAVAGGEAADSQTLQNLGMGAVAVGLTPWALAKIMSNPRLVRTLTDGMVAGPGTSKFARAVMVATTQNKAALKEMVKMSPEAQEFYDNPSEMEPEEQEQPAAVRQPTTLGTLEGTAGAFFPEQPLE